MYACEMEQKMICLDIVMAYSVIIKIIALVGGGDNEASGICKYSTVCPYHTQTEFINGFRE